MAGVVLTRRTPLRRTGRVRPRREDPRRSSRVENPHYLAWLRLQRCGVAVAFPAEASRCAGPTDPEHKREGVGMGQRASDVDAWGCCRLHHDERHDGRGVFAAMDRATLRQFINCQIGMYRAAYTVHLAGLRRDRARTAEVDALALPDSLAASKPEENRQ